MATAAEEADLIMVLVPDELQPEVYETYIAPHLKTGDTLAFAHGFNVHYGYITPPEDVNVIMCAPKGPGHIVRRQYTEGSGVPDLICVAQDATGDAWDIALSYAWGVGGARAGNVASRLACEVFCGEVCRSLRDGMTEAEEQDVLCTAAKLANISVYEHAQLSEEFRGMGTTLVAALVRGLRVEIVNIGDSRAYHLGADGIRCVTVDHSLVELMVQRGELTHEQAKNHPSKNLITRAVGTEKQVAADVFSLTAEPGDCLLLCSDGLSSQMADQEILFEVVHGAQKADCCQRLLDIAKSRGAPDNVTSVLIAL